MMKEYKPEPPQKAILDFAYGVLGALPYKISLRSLFYPLLQKGFYKTKEDMLKWKKLCAKARNRFYGDWRPWTLEDDTRRVVRDIDYWEMPSIGDYLKTLPEHLARMVIFSIDHFYHQDVYVEIWFESRGMRSQFEYFTKGIPIDKVPLGGDTSIPIVWEVAKGLEEKRDRYGKKIIVLYFGDYDKPGKKIKEKTAERVKRWSEAEFKIEWCGLTADQVRKYDLPEKPGKPGSYEWESFVVLGDRGHEIAGKIIKDSISKYIDLSIIEKASAEATREEDKWREFVRKEIQELVKNHVS